MPQQSSPHNPPHHVHPQLRALTAEEYDAFTAAGDRGFHEQSPQESRDAFRTMVDPARFFGFVAGQRWISTFGSFARSMTVPGGRSIPVAAISDVTVHSTYRRRGLLRAMMAEEFLRCRRRGESVAALFASESGIYGRFGFGHAAADLRLAGRTRDLDLRPEVAALLATAGGSVDEVEPADYLAAATVLHDMHGATRPGTLSRSARWWSIRMLDPETWREGATALRHVLSYDESGQVDGHAMYRVKADYVDGLPAGDVRVHELAAASAVAHARLWRYLTQLDLVRTISVHRAPDDTPALHQVADSRALRAHRRDGLHVRILDVESALSARAYAADIDIVLEVRDDQVPENAGRYRLAASGDGSIGAAVSARTADAPHLTLGVRELGAVFLGGTSLGALHAAGLVTEHRAGAVARAAAAFGWPVAPFCSDTF